MDPIQLQQKIDRFEERIQNLEQESSLLKNSNTIPLSIDQAFRARFGRSLFATATLDFGSTAAQNSDTKTVTVTGATIGDAVVLGVDNVSQAGLGIFSAWVSSADTVTVKFNNLQTAGSLDPGSGLFTVVVLKK